MRKTTKNVFLSLLVFSLVVLTNCSNMTKGNNLEDLHKDVIQLQSGITLFDSLDKDKIDRLVPTTSSSISFSQLQVGSVMIAKNSPTFTKILVTNLIDHGFEFRYVVYNTSGVSVANGSTTISSGATRMLYHSSAIKFHALELYMAGAGLLLN